MAQVANSLSFNNFGCYQHHAMMTFNNRSTSSSSVTSSPPSSTTSSVPTSPIQQWYQQQQPRFQQAKQRLQYDQRVKTSSGTVNSKTFKPLGPIGSGRSVLFPFNPSLEDELNRLFANFVVEKTSPIKTEAVWEEFKLNGKDFEYCPDDRSNRSLSPLSKKKNKKPLPTECVFCKNNGEPIRTYKTHLLKDADGNIVCPVLSNYTCPICGACGSKAHTVKYCPSNKGASHLASMNMLKSMRNSTGRRRSK